MDYVNTSTVTTRGPALAGAPLLRGAPDAFEGDADLAAALQKGEKLAAGVAFARFSPVVHGTLRRMLGPGEDIADLAQDVFARFFSKVETLRTLESLRSFITGIAFRRAREEIRRRHVRRTLRPFVESHLRGSNDVWHPESRQQAIRLLDRLENLGLDGRIYAMRTIEGQDLVEVAEATGLSISTVRRRLARASKRVQRWSREGDEAADSTFDADDQDDLELAA